MPLRRCRQRTPLAVAASKGHTALCSFLVLQVWLPDCVDA